MQYKGIYPADPCQPEEPQKSLRNAIVIPSGRRAVVIFLHVTLRIVTENGSVGNLPHNNVGPYISGGMMDK